MYKKNQIFVVCSAVYPKSPQKHTSGLLQIQGNLFNGEVSVERGDLFAHDKEMFDKEELPVYLSLGRNTRVHFTRLRSYDTLSDTLLMHVYRNPVAL